MTDEKPDDLAERAALAALTGLTANPSLADGSPKKIGEAALKYADGFMDAVEKREGKAQSLSFTARAALERNEEKDNGRD